MGFFIPQLRKQIIGKDRVVPLHTDHPELFSFLGNTTEERVRTISERVLPDAKYASERVKRKELFEYIYAFLEDAVLDIPYMGNIGRGLNLAKRPFLAPAVSKQQDGFTFTAQYRWDTYFHNLLLSLIGGHDLAIGQLLNFADVFDEYKRVPNALVTVYLSNAQPPLEAMGMSSLVSHGAPKGKWIDAVMNMVEQDLFLEWWDEGAGYIHFRQNHDITSKFGLLTKYTRIHLNSLMAGCEDGKDHNWTTITYGYNYLPVQLNAIIYNMLEELQKYYGDTNLGNNQNKAQIYQQLVEQMRADFHKTFWHDQGKWRGFRNYSLLPGEEGPVLYGDLAAEIFPLWVGIASADQAKITRDNLERYYKGEYGLATTSLELREGGTLKGPPPGPWKFQWEYPNCWPPLMYIAVEGLKKYGFVEDAFEYEKKWVRYIEEEFVNMKVFTEKQPYTKGVDAEKGLYGMIHGFGWTIGVYLYFLKDLAQNNLL